MRTPASYLRSPRLDIPLDIRDLTEEDLPHISWAGDQVHLQRVRAALGRRDVGEAEYLCVAAPNGRPLAIAGIDFAVEPGVGSIWGLGVIPALRSCGLGTLLMLALQHRASSRGLSGTSVLVEETNPDARRLYTRLGYAAAEQAEEQWERSDPSDPSDPRLHTASCLVMRRTRRDPLDLYWLD